MSQPAETFPPDDEGELALYYLHNLLHTTHFKLHPPTLTQRAEIAGALSYLDSKDPTRAALVRRCLRMAAVMAKEATELLNESVDWPTVERLFSPSEDEFRDSPQNWLAVARCDAARPQSPHDEPPAAPEPAAAALPPPANKASLRRHGRTLRSECEAEKARFYAIARDHGLPTGEAAADAMREALSDLFQTPNIRRRDMTARQWSKAASAIETGDLFWTMQPQRPRPKASSNGHAAAPQP